MSNLYAVYSWLAPVDADSSPEDTPPMRITLDYGRTGLDVDLPDDRVVGPLAIRPAAPLRRPRRRPSPTPWPTRSARRRWPSWPAAAATPASSSATSPGRCPTGSSCRRCCAPSKQQGIAREDILILVATGLHRPNEGAELDELVGPEIAAQLPHREPPRQGRWTSTTTSAPRPTACRSGSTRRYVRADLKITTGLIEPHLMAGYSGGRKVICPGIAGLETVKVWHGPRFLEHPKADCGIVEGNPVHEENTRIALMAGCDFIVNVCLDGQRRITWVGAGDMIEAWEEGVRFVESVVKVPVPRAGRRGGHQLRRLPARHDVVPGGQGADRGAADRQAGRHDRPGRQPDRGARQPGVPAA